MSDERGFLTRTDREFLTGEHEYTGESAKQQRYQRREAIAERTRQAFYDFAFLYEVLDEHERNRIFNPDDRQPLRDALVDTIAFLYVALHSTGTPPNRSVRVPFSSILETGVKKGLIEVTDIPAESASTALIDVEYDIEITEGYDSDTYDRAVGKLKEDGPVALTEEEMFSVLFRHSNHLIADTPDFAALDLVLEEDPE